MSSQINNSVMREKNYKLCICLKSRRICELACRLCLLIKETVSKIYYINDKRYSYYYKKNIFLLKYLLKSKAAS